MKEESELVQKLKDKAFQTENDKKLIESFEIERVQQLTAVEWFYEQLPGHIRVSEKGLEILQQAKEMEKEQREQDFINGYKARAELSGLIFDEASELTAKEQFKQQEQ
jgi:hypothetical protein